ncbi:MAG: hypothetical protein GXO40_03220 [Epsilonproteobacteria bacterium]|nr:hypothetical protein [Campylobacterota bacterium]
MKKLIILILGVLAFGLKPIYTDITDIHNLHAKIDKNIPKGMSGYVIHDGIIAAKAISLGNQEVIFKAFDKLQNTALATPKILPHIGDKIVFRLYNFRSLIIAPNQNIYLAIKSKYPHLTFVSSDIFATYFVGKPTKDDFRKFCQDFNIGIIFFVIGNQEYLVDSGSFYVLEHLQLHQAYQYDKAFFSMYEHFNDSLFDSQPDDWNEYYRKLLKE